ncbi:MAG TPA: hypothetical protein VLF60_04595 [Candidatus Saccharimonadales bacterium]|nr:hypothetical protein [Candidatus Saccharimonadales bacterium]
MLESEIYTEHGDLHPYVATVRYEGDTDTQASDEGETAVSLEDVLAKSIATEQVLDPIEEELPRPQLQFEASLKLLVAIPVDTSEDEGETPPDAAAASEDLLDDIPEVDPTPETQAAGSGGGIEPPERNMEMFDENDDDGEGGEEAQSSEDATEQVPLRQQVQYFHYVSDGAVYVNEFPQDPRVQEYAEEVAESQARRMEAFCHFVDEAPNLNDTFAEELEEAKRYLEEEGLSSGQIIVLPQTYFDQALDLLHFEKSFEMGGAAMGRALVPVPGNLGSLERNYVQAMALHEGSHLHEEEAQPVLVSKVPEGENPLNRVHVLHAGLGGFVRYDVQDDGEVREKGLFWGEGFADVHRVKGMERAGKTPRLGRRSMMIGGIRYVGEDAAPPPDLQFSLPVRYAVAVKRFGVTNPSGISLMTAPAAYGLDLLDARSPGLLALMKEAHADLSRLDEFKSAVNDIRPGLFEQLDVLQYTPRDFIKGARIIENALVR